MEERVSKMPSTSPYTLLEGESDAGSPAYMFTRLAEKPKAEAKYISATPGMGNKVASARRVLGNISSNRKGTPARDGIRQFLMRFFYWLAHETDHYFCLLA